eukprot:jgi/Bigna1/80843/fgenesh1_pg.75_\
MTPKYGYPQGAKAEEPSKLPLESVQGKIPQAHAYRASNVSSRAGNRQAGELSIPSSKAAFHDVGFAQHGRPHTYLPPRFQPSNPNAPPRPPPPQAPLYPSYSNRVHPYESPRAYNRERLSDYKAPISSPYNILGRGYNRDSRAFQAALPTYPAQSNISSQQQYSSTSYPAAAVRNMYPSPNVQQQHSQQRVFMKNYEQGGSGAQLPKNSNLNSQRTPSAPMMYTYISYDPGSYYVSPGYYNRGKVVPSYPLRSSDFRVPDIGSIERPAPIPPPVELPKGSQRLTKKTKFRGAVQHADTIWIMNPETGRKNLRYRCTFCQTTMRTRSSIIEHIRTHTGEEPYVCNVCGTRFKQKSNFRRHCATHDDKKARCWNATASMSRKDDDGGGGGGGDNGDDDARSKDEKKVETASAAKSDAITEDRRSTAGGGGGEEVKLDGKPSIAVEASNGLHNGKSALSSHGIVPAAATASAPAIVQVSPHSRAKFEDKNAAVVASVAPKEEITRTEALSSSPDCNNSSDVVVEGGGGQRGTKRSKDEAGL